MATFASSSSKKSTAFHLFGVQPHSSVSLRGASRTPDSAEALLQQARQARQQRAAQRARELAALRVQACWRAVTDLRQFRRQCVAWVARAMAVRGTARRRWTADQAARLMRVLAYVVATADVPGEDERSLWAALRSCREVKAEQWGRFADSTASRILLAAIKLGDSGLLQGAWPSGRALAWTSASAYPLLACRPEWFASVACRLLRECGASAAFAQHLLTVEGVSASLAPAEAAAMAPLLLHSALLYLEKPQECATAATRRLLSNVLALPVVPGYVLAAEAATAVVGPDAQLGHRLGNDALYVRELALAALRNADPDAHELAALVALLQRHEGAEPFAVRTLALWRGAPVLPALWQLVSSWPACPVGVSRVFARMYLLALRIMDDDDFYAPPQTELAVAVSAHFKQRVFRALFPRALATSHAHRMDPAFADAPNLDAVSELLRVLHARDARRPFTTDPATFWPVPLPTAALETFVAEAVRAGGDVPLLRAAPFTVPFVARVRIFHGLIAQEKEQVGGGLSFFGMNGIWITIRREFIVEDALAELNVLGARLRENVRVRFVDGHGIEEVGIDGGGVFKEFMHELVQMAFSPSHYGLFKANENGELFPNPSAALIAPAQHLEHFTFLGRVLGKALYDSVLVDLPFASFFARKLLGHGNDLNDMRSLDPTLHRNLKYLQHADAPTVADLGLTFTVVDNEFDEAVEHELVPGGSARPVTERNRLEYMLRLADHRLNRQIQAQTQAFLAGLHDVIQPQWIRLFNERELRELISGDTSGKIDVDDLRQHVNYSGGYTESSAAVLHFWAVLHDEFSDEERAALLQFVTSSSRAPLLGFRYLNPPLCIHQAGEDLERLPTASTCMNLLKLPPYPDRRIMRDKLRYAIRQNTGFGLS